MPLFIAGAALVGTGAGVYSANRQRQASNQQANQQAQIARETLEAGRFKPYGVNSSFSRTRFNTAETAEANRALAQKLGVSPTMQGRGEYRTFSGPRGGSTVEQWVDNPNAGRMGFIDPSTGQFYDTEAQVYNELDDRVQSGINTQLDSGKTNLQRANDRSKLSPEDLAKDRFSRYMEMVRPQQLADFDKLLGGLAINGTQGDYNNLTKSNQPIAAFAQGLANSDKEAYDRSILTEQALTDMLQARGNRDFNSAGSIENLGRQDVSLGAELGGRNMNTQAANAGQFGMASAQTRAQGENMFTDTMTGGIGNFLKQNQGGIQQGLRALFGGSTNTGGYGGDVGPRFNLGEGGI